MKESSIVVFGEALVDFFKLGMVVGGAPFNVARHLAGFKTPLHFISAIGNDNAGYLIREDLKFFEIDVSGVQSLSNVRSGSVQVHESDSGHRFEILSDCAYDYIDAKAALDGLRAFNANTNESVLSKQIFYHGSLALRQPASYQAFQVVVNELKKNHVRIFLDINWREGHVPVEQCKKILEQANIIKMSDDELRLILNWYGLEFSNKDILPVLGEIDQHFSKLMCELSAGLLLVTYGKNGSAAINNIGQCIAVELSTPSPSVVDTVGAGDAFSSIVLIGLNKGWQMDLILQRANAFAKAICEVRGAVPLSPYFYQKHAENWF